MAETAKYADAQKIFNKITTKLDDTMERSTKRVENASGQLFYEMKNGYMTPKQLFDAMDNVDVLPKAQQARITEVFEETMKTMQNNGYALNDTGTGLVKVGQPVKQATANLPKASK